MDVVVRSPVLPLLGRLGSHGIWTAQSGPGIANLGLVYARGGGADRVRVRALAGSVPPAPPCGPAQTHWQADAIKGRRMASSANEGVVLQETSRDF